MKRWRMNKTTIGYSLVATVLALCSLPSLPNQAHGPLHLHHGAENRHRAVPTLAPVQAQAITPGKAATPAPTAPGTTQPSPTPPTAPGTSPTPGGAPAPTNPQPLYQVGKLRIRVIDGRTMAPLRGAEVVLVETEERLTTDANGYTDWFVAPIIRNPKYRPMVAELHGQLGVVVYKNGYRDSVHLGIRIHDEKTAQATVWMYKIGPGDRRIEPVLYEEPYHHLWLIDLADKFRSKSQPGEGPQRP